MKKLWHLLTFEYYHDMSHKAHLSDEYSVQLRPDYSLGPFC